MQPGWWVSYFWPIVDVQVVIVFSAHSIPMKVVNKGDQYVPEVAASVKAVVERVTERLRDKHGRGVTIPRHILAWQSKVGFLPWMVPSTATVLEGLGKRNTKQVLAVPIAFTSDHIETLVGTFVPCFLENVFLLRKHATIALLKLSGEMLRSYTPLHLLSPRGVPHFSLSYRRLRYYPFCIFLRYVLL
jgi:hypothetical protein